jgi:predicted O-linked N-acetylglucosamine transferase (SPINDLY family)
MDAPGDALARQVASTVRLAAEHYGAGRHAEAAGLLEELIERTPGLARAWFLLGVVENARGAAGAAIERLEHAAALAPDDREIAHFLARTLTAGGHVARAIDRYRALVRLAPGNAAAQTELGALLQGVGQLDAAIACHEAAVAADPRSVAALNNLGAALLAARRPEAALSALQRALEIAPDRPEVVLNAGKALKQLGRLELAAEVLGRARPGESRLAGELALLHGNVLSRLGRASGARDALEEAVLADDRNPAALGRLLREAENACDWARVEVLKRRARQLLHAGGPVIHPFGWLSLSADPMEQRLAADRWVAQAAMPRPGPAPEPSTGARIHLGYVCADFHDHATPQLLVEVIERHDRRRFRVTAYSQGPDDGSAMRRRLEGAFDTFADISGLSDEAAAARIRDDRVDILIDLKGWTRVAAMRPAPIVVSHVGYPGTIGGRFADYLVGDPTVSPLDHAAHFAEKLVLLPDSYQPNDRRRPLGPAVARRDCGLPGDAIVLCSHNQTYKFTPEVFGVWCEALAAEPRAVLWVLKFNPVAIENLRREMAGRGVSPDRLVAGPLLPLPGHLARLACADLFLDTYPCNAHTSASDALWVGVPVLTRCGPTFASRVGASLLRAAELPELVTHTPDDYRARLLELVASPARLRTLKSGLLARRDRIPLFDSERYTRHLEDAYRSMWARRARGEAPDHVVVERSGTAPAAQPE